MKFKVFLFGMVAAALMMSCNNETVYQGTDDPNNYEGFSTHATFNLNIGKVSTYAGYTEHPADDYELTVSDAAMYIYKVSGATIAPEAMAYIDADADLGTPRMITMATTSGQKKIFVALNVSNSATNPILDNNGGNSTFTNHQDTGIVYNTNPFVSLNNVLYSAAVPANGFTTTAPALLTNPAVRSANGLIQTFAGGSIDPADGLIYHYGVWPTDNTARYCFMSNWDGPDDFNSGGYDYESKCLFTLAANVSLTASKSLIAAENKGNHVEIFVQRAYAKISLRITANGATPSSSAIAPYESSEADGSKGKFTPWTDGTSTTAYIWSLGGINKMEYPFQQFGKDFGGSYPDQVLSPNWQWSVGDTLDVGNEVNSDEWYTNYDNTRVFAARSYLTPANTVSNVLTTMTSPNNYVGLSPADILNIDDFNYAFATENGTEYPQKQDKSTYVIIGGVYAPENVVTEVLKPGTNTADADVGWNDFTTVAGAGLDQGFGSNTYYSIPYPNSGTVDPLDTLYYLANLQVFIHGSDNLAKYIAWALKKDLTLTAPTLDDPAVAAYINALRKTDTKSDEEFFAYYQGNCWYRVWVREPALAKGSRFYDEVLVRRNHIYDINITKILGPGIADPNTIIIPGEIIPEQETFVSVDITQLMWHLVDSQHEVGNK